jgi:hypothetical protein
MSRSLIALALVLAARAAHAAPEPWSLELGPGWADITAETLASPEVGALRSQITSKGGTFAAKAFRHEETGFGLFIVTSDIPDIDSLRAREVMEKAARERGRQGKVEVSYQDDKSATLFRSTQVVKLDGIVGTSRRYEGFLKSERFRVISANCYGEPPPCAQLLDKIVIDESVFVPLADVPAEPSQLKRWLAVGASGVVVLLIFVGAIVTMRRRRA